MNKDAMKTSLGLCGLPLLAAGLLAVAWLPGCGGAADNPSNQLDGSFSGSYANPLGGAMVSTNSGTPVTLFKITQSRDVLEAVDNAGNVFRGTFSIAYAYGGMIQLDGTTGAGTPVHIAGYMESSDATAWINASWIEPGFKASMYGTAQITPFSPTNPAVWTR